MICFECGKEMRKGSRSKVIRFLKKKSVVARYYCVTKSCLVCSVEMVESV